MYDMKGTDVLRDHTSMTSEYFRMSAFGGPPLSANVSIRMPPPAPRRIGTSMRRYSLKLVYKKYYWSANLQFFNNFIQF